MRQAREIITTVIIALIVYVLLQFTVQPFKVYGQSMMPNVEPGDYIMINKIGYYFTTPHRGEVILFHHPRSPKTNLIKRVIGLPGDTVVIEDDKLFINDIELEEDYVQGEPDYEYLRNEIPVDHYFVLGDNRNNSSDSRNGWTVPSENIIGKAWFNYWPVSHWGAIEHYSPDMASK